MVTGAAARQVGLDTTAVTVTPGAGAAIPCPLLVKSTSTWAPKLEFSVAENCWSERRSRRHRRDAGDVGRVGNRDRRRPGENAGKLALEVWPPAGIVTLVRQHADRGCITRSHREKHRQPEQARKLNGQGCKSADRCVSVRGNRDIPILHSTTSVPSVNPPAAT